MAKKLSLSLSSQSINEMIKKIQNIQDSVENAKIEAVQEVLEGAKEEVISRTPYDTGASASSTTYTIGATKATLQQSGDHVAYNEFGTGIVGSSNPHPNMPNGWTYSSKIWGFENTNPSSRWYGVHFTAGQPAHAQMYHGSQYIRNNITKIMKQKVSGALSRI